MSATFVFAHISISTTALMIHIYMYNTTALSITMLSTVHLKTQTCLKMATKFRKLFYFMTSLYRYVHLVGKIIMNL